jgi:predicted secreted protein
MFHVFRKAHGLPRGVCAACSLLVASLTFAASPWSVNLSSEASRPAANDLMQATLSAEATGAKPGDVSRQVNQTIAEALALVKTYPEIKVQSGGTSTYPVYDAKGGRIESWRMRSHFLLESGDTPALSELLGKLQTSLAVSGLRLLPSPETKRKAEDAAILEAIRLFETRAKLLADAQGKKYSIRELSIHTGGLAPLLVSPPRSRAASAGAAPMPIESGESMVSVSVSGKIEIE